jgi:hypothetical protein
MKRLITSLALVAALSVTLSAQQTPLQNLEAIQTLVDILRVQLTPVCTDAAATNLGGPLPCVYPPPAVTTEAGLQAALTAGQSVIKVSNSLVYTTALNIVAPVTIEAETLPTITRDAVTGKLLTLEGPMPTFQNGITVASAASGVTLRGLEIHKIDPLTDITTIYGSNVTMNQNRILGDPTAGAKRGIGAKSNGNLVITQNYIADCFQSYPGNDSQAILAYDMLPGLIIEDNYLEGGSETVMVGGADSTSPARDPKDITIRANTLTKKLAWKTLAVGVKNTLEFKNARNVLVEDNIIENSWLKGQDGYLVMLTTRNQSGGNPTARLQNIVIRNNVIRHGAAAVNVLGNDNLQVSEALDNVEIYNNIFEDIAPNVWTATSTAGNKKMFQIGRGSNGLSIHDNVVRSSSGSTSILYFYGSAASNVNTAFNFSNNQVIQTTYGIFGEAGSSPSPVTATWPSAMGIYAAGGTFTGNTIYVP